MNLFVFLFWIDVQGAHLFCELFFVSVHTFDEDVKFYLNYLTAIRYLFVARCNSIPVIACYN